MRSLHILLIEDHSPLAPYIHRTLESEGFHVTTATGIHGATRHLSESKWPLIILDHIFPSPSAHELVHLIKKDNPDVEILALSEHSLKQTIEELSKSELEHYLLKPFSFQDLIKQVKLMTKQTGGAAGELSLDTLSIDTKSQVVKRDGKNITLTKKEFTLLLFLLKNKDKAVSRSDLLEHVWGMQIDPLSNTIEAHILSLRRKVDFTGQTKLIQTVPRFGYRLSINK